LQERDHFGGHSQILADDKLAQSDRQPLESSLSLISACRMACVIFKSAELFD
jgi:hypothetical protein